MWSSGHYVTLCVPMWVFSCHHYHHHHHRRHPPPGFTDFSLTNYEKPPVSLCTTSQENVHNSSPCLSASCVHTDLQHALAWGEGSPRVPVILMKTESVVGTNHDNNEPLSQKRHDGATGTGSRLTRPHCEWGKECASR